jgi:hypothetical protein
LKKFKPVQIPAELQEEFKIVCVNKGEYMVDRLEMLIKKWLWEVKHENTGRATAKMEQS